MSRRPVMPVLVAALSLVAAACGGGQEANRTDATPSQAGASASQSAPAAAPNRCPLTAEQVSAAVGTPVKEPDTACGFYPVDDAKLLPNVTFVRQNAIACRGSLPAESGYEDQVNGLGPTAYSNESADGLWLLVCQGSTPFEVRVDAQGADLRRAAAIALARQVLAGS